MAAVGLLTLFINRLYTTNCAMPCGYFDGTRDVVIKIGVGLLLLGIALLAYSTARVLIGRGKRNT